MIDYEYYFEQYRRVPRNSTSNSRELLDFQSTTTLSAYDTWARAIKRPVKTTYIDGSTFFGMEERPNSIKGSFPKGKGRRKPSAFTEKRQNPTGAFMSLVPSERSFIDASTVRSEKNRSPLSMTTATQISNLPDVPRKPPDHHRSHSATVFDDEHSHAKFFARCATTCANGSWVRRYKSMNESHTLTDIMREQAYQDQILLRKRGQPQLHLLSSSSASSFISSFNKRRRAKT